MTDNTFVFVAPMRNASATVGQMLASIVGQSYHNWRIILIDDASDHHEVVKEVEVINRWRAMVTPGWVPNMIVHDKIDVVWNDDRLWEVANVLKGISMCEDEDVVCRIDGDDYLTDLDALAILNVIYNQTGADALWTAHRWALSDKNISGPMPEGAVDVYKHPWVSSHLKTFRKRLINGVNDVNFRGPDGEYVRRAGDQALYLPILHQATKRGFVPRVFYHYTIKDEPATYQTPDARFQRDEAVFLRQRGYVK
jgi:glycosyltransferase involved in cell wall biosynthesis